MMGMPWDQDCIWEYTINDVPGDIAQCSMTMEQHMLPADLEEMFLEVLTWMSLEVSLCQLHQNQGILEPFRTC